jgi:hypothetical protein
MQIIRVVRGTFMVGGQPLAHHATLQDDGKPGVYNLCKNGDTWELYYTSDGTSPAVRADNRLKEAMRALLDWHKKDDNCKDCVERGGGQGWELCLEGQELLAGS